MASLIILVAMLAQIPSASETDLARLRRVLTSSRIAASNELDTRGSLSPAKQLALKKSVENANALWIACIMTTVDANVRSSVPAVTVADRAIVACRSDGVELTAWMRLGVRAEGSTLSNAEIASIMARSDKWNREAAIARVTRLRAQR